MMSPPSVPVGRLAPSPTGALHVGHARSFLLAWWSVRSRGGRVLLRIDDLDHTRLRPGMVDACLRDLEWLGLPWDGPIVLQSQRTELYMECAHRLLGKGLAYPCTCTRKEIALAASAPHEADGESAYPGTCRGRYDSLAEAETGRPASLRFCVPPGEQRWQDLILGPQSTSVAQQSGDFLLTRRDQVIAYQLACAVDDGSLGVNEVLRGVDLASSTPRQMLLQEALGLPSPAWAHVGLVTDLAGERLAKRNQAIRLGDLREAGLDPRRLVAWVAQGCGMPVGPLATAQEALGHFSLEALDAHPVAFDPAGLQDHA